MISKKEWKTIYRRKIRLHTCYCYLCGKPIEREKDFSLEHAQPLSRNGCNDFTNWQPSHKSCNSAKGSLTYEEWLLYQELVKKKNGIIR